MAADTTGLSLLGAVSGAVMPSLRRSVSGTFVVNGHREPQQRNLVRRGSSGVKRKAADIDDFRTHTTVEERLAVRAHIRAAFSDATLTRSYEELLDVASALQEEMLFVTAQSKLEFYSQGYQFPSVVEKKCKSVLGSGGALRQRPGRSTASPDDTASDVSSVSGGEAKATHRC